ncbi:leucine-rich repeat domain-containing protein [Legionella clemsonensis]|uniref:Leucine Rich repeats (2 copies) n=1 Tax=Legionella clemsonensis TaxID=1867846 RepID=A0A222NYM8_9GAMM|nr:hypothetical protein [Legionella clemsonensis]ASQ44665.1 hypothetical protein clem_00495 [Legionella clemsonensis]
MPYKGPHSDMFSLHWAEGLNPSVKGVIQELNTISKDVTMLCLDLSSFQHFSSEELVDIFKAIPANVTSLHLAGQFSDDLSHEQLFEVWQAIPKTIASLHLFKISRIVSVLPESITALHLSGGALNNKATEELVQLIQSIPASVTTLDLRNNSFGSKSTDELIAILQAVPASLISLYLMNNGLGHKPAEELKAIFAVFSGRPLLLNLSHNHLFKDKNAAEKDQVLNALGENSQRFILTRNGESDLARARWLMPAIMEKYNLPSEIASHILFFLGADSPYNTGPSFFKFQLKKATKTIEEIKEKRAETRQCL